MEHDNVDKHIKQKLEQRTIQPSLEAWNKLSITLDEENKYSNKRGYYKYVVAASVVFLLGFFFISQYNNTKAIIIDNAVVVTEKNNVETSVNKVVVAPIINHLKNDTGVKIHIGEKDTIIDKDHDNYAYTESFRREKKRQEEEIKAIKEKVSRYLIQLEKGKQEKLENKNKEYDLDVEIEALLAEASNSLPRKLVENSTSVFQLDKETDMLLADAFKELDIHPEEDTVNETLKNRLFKQLEKGYFKSKILLAERNQRTLY